MKIQLFKMKLITFPQYATMNSDFFMVCTLPYSHLVLGIFRHPVAKLSYTIRSLLSMPIQTDYHQR